MHGSCAICTEVEAERAAGIDRVWTVITRAARDAIGQSIIVQLNRGIAAGGRTIISKADSTAQVYSGYGDIPVAIRNGSAQLHQAIQSQAGFLIGSGVRRMHNRPLLIQCDLTARIYRHGEGNTTGNTAYTAHDHTGLVVQQDIAAAGRVIQTTVDTRCTDTQAIDRSTCNIRTEVSAEQATKIGSGITQQVTFIYLQAVISRGCGTDTRTVVIEGNFAA